MTPNKTIALIGGTGKAGKYLLQQLLAQNFTVKLLHRKPENLTGHHPLLQIIKGDVLDTEAITELLKGCTTVLSCLGQPTGQSPVFEDATRLILATMHQTNIKRYILVAGLNVDAPADEKSGATLAGTNYMKQHYPEISANRQAEYELLSKSSIDWTMVRIPLLIQTGSIAPVSIDLNNCPGDKINGKDLAHFIIRQIDDTDYIEKAPFIASV